MDVGDEESGLVEQVDQALVGEEADVGRIEQPRRLIVKPTLEQRQAQIDVGDVRDREHHGPLRRQFAHGGTQHRQRFEQVLEHVAGQHGIERPGDGVEHGWVVEVADDREVGDLLQIVGHRRVDLDRRDVVAALAQGACHVAGRGAELEHSVVFTREQDEGGVRVVRLGDVDRCFVAAAHAFSGDR